jgi:hypothetical protein
VSNNNVGCRIRSAGDLLGAVPYLLGFHPENSFVALLIDTGRRVQAGARADLDVPIDELARSLRQAWGPQTAAIVVAGYGPVPDPERLNALIRGLRRDVVVAGGFWVTATAYRCVWDGCDCPARGGVAFDARATVSAATLTAQGQIAVASRTELLSQLAPDPAAQACVRTVLDQRDGPDPLFTLDDALGLARRGQRLSDGQVAALLVALRDPQVRDQAWQATDDLQWQRQLWFDLTRRAPDACVSVVAALAAWWSWRAGHELLAREALTRAWDNDPAAPLAGLVARLVTARIDPASLAWPIDPTNGVQQLRSRTEPASPFSGIHPAA